MRKRAMGYELTIKKSDGVTNDQKKRSDGVRVDDEKKSDGVRVYQKKERWGDSSP